MNVMMEYLKINKRFITKYMKLVLSNKYNRKIAEEFYKTYVENRYSLIDEQLGKLNLKNEILKSLDNLKKDLIKQDKETKDIVEQTRLCYNYVLYFDYVINSKSIEKIILQIAEKKYPKYGQEHTELASAIYGVYLENQKEVQDFIKKFNSKEFGLEFNKSKNNPDIKRTKITHNIKFPLLYSEYAIEKAMETEPISEDILFVEYYLLASTIIDDITKGNVKSQYIVSLPVTVLSKKQKARRLLEILNSEFMKYKITFEISYKNFEKNKAKIYDLISQGYKFAVLIENEKLKQENIKRLEVFKYIITDENTSKTIENSNSKIQIIKF